MMVQVDKELALKPKVLQSNHNIHQLANFPSDLELCHQPGQGLSLEPQDPSSFSDDVKVFGIAARTWDAAYHLVDYLSGSACPSEIDNLNQSPRVGDVVSFAHGPDRPTVPLPSLEMVLPPPQFQFDPPSPLFEALGSGKIHLLDLGSGTCYLPISLARNLSDLLPSKLVDSISITATDLPTVLPLMQRNTLSAHKPGQIQVLTKSLVWGHTRQALSLLHSLDLANTRLLITCSDLVFFPFLFAPLLRTLLVLTSPISPAKSPAVIFGYKERSAVKEFPFFELLGRYFLIQPILSRSHSDQPWSIHKPQSQIHLFQATRHHSTLNLDFSLISDNDLSSYEQSRLKAKHMG
ncbi:hypothetical protein O181_039449 [Austropuccinia psidii MF-1]|uniref:Uncharacterized protein n=1 Tax=Austropuccinia psidii MF-1 TaxID=1389203 RepID=A0A9Q3HEK1_9BASI|nr:hypothetical protein [Austropuccinia psidii MF-1]